jgi:hypothetical protein
MTRSIRGRPNPIRATAIEGRRAKILELAALGYSTRQIAGQLGVPMLQVQRDAKIVRQRRILEAIVLDDQLAQRSIAVYQRIMQLAYEGFVRSLEDEVSVEEAVTVGKGGRKRMELVKRMIKGQAGSNPFLQTMINAQAKIDEINGLLGKDRFDAGAAEQTTPFLLVEVESREQLAEYEALTFNQAKDLIVEGSAKESAGHAEK